MDKFLQYVVKLSRLLGTLLVIVLITAAALLLLAPEFLIKAMMIALALAGLLIAGYLCVCLLRR